MGQVTSVIVDASLAIKWVLDEEHSLEARTQRVRWAIRNIDVRVPSWFGCEIANVLFQSIRSQRLTLEEAELKMGVVASFVSVLDVEFDLAPRALRIALATGQKASYDSYYVALAEHHDCELWTADVRFWRTVNPAFPFVQWLGNERIAAEPEAQ